MATKKVILGRGLSSLLGESPTTREKSEQSSTPAIAKDTLPIDSLQRGKYQPRLSMDDSALEELARSIEKQGIIQPIVVRKINDSKYEILAGERRWTAARKAKLKEVPVIIKDIDDQSALAIALIENLQREDLNALEEAKALDRLIKEFSLTHQQAAEAVGKSRVAVSNLLRLLSLPIQIQKHLNEGRIEMGHARALLTLEPAVQIKMADLIIEKNLSVRDTEGRVKSLNQPHMPMIKIRHRDPSHVISFKQQLSDKIELPFEVKAFGTKGAKVTFNCKTEDDLKALLQKLN